MVGRQSYAPPENVPINKGNRPEQIAPAVSMSRSRECGRWMTATEPPDRVVGGGRAETRRQVAVQGEPGAGTRSPGCLGGPGERRVRGGAHPPGRCSADSSRDLFIRPTAGLTRWTAPLHRWGTMLGAGDGSAQGHTAAGPKGCALSTPWPTWMPSL